MAVTTTEVAGKDQFLYINDIIVGCATTSSLQVSVDMLEASCKSTGGWKARKPGQKSWKVSLSGVQKTYATGDAATNYSVDQFFSALLAGDVLPIKWGTAVVGSQKYEGDGYVVSWTEEAPTDGLATYSIEIEGTDELTQSAVV